MGVIYKITSPTDKIYIGQTVDQKRRISDYRFKNKRYNTILFNSIKKYGWKMHLMEIIEDNVPEDKLSEREMFWIKELNTYHVNNKNGMNMTIGGEGHRGSWMHDIERRKRESEKRKGPLGSFYGKHHTEEVKKYISEFMSERNKKMGIKVPDWGAEKGWEKVRRAVLAYDSKGNFISQHKSLTEAAKCLNINIQCVKDSVLKGSLAAERFYFKYKTDNYELKISPKQKKKRKIKDRPIICFFNSYQLRYKNIYDVELDLGIPKMTVHCASYRPCKMIRGKYIFIYEDKYNDFIKMA